MKKELSSIKQLLTEQEQESYSAFDRLLDMSLFIPTYQPHQSSQGSAQLLKLKSYHPN